MHWRMGRVPRYLVLLELHVHLGAWWGQIGESRGKGSE